MYEPEHNHKSGFTIVQVRNGENRKRKQMIHAINKPISYLTLSGFKLAFFYLICTSNEPPNVMVVEAALAQDRPQFWVT